MEVMGEAKRIATHKNFFMFLFLLRFIIHDRIFSVKPFSEMAYKFFISILQD